MQGRLRWLKSRLEKYEYYRVAREIKWFAKGKIKQVRSPEKAMVSLKPEGLPRGNVLLSYVKKPFYLRAGQTVSSAHTHDWESLQIGRTFLDLGFCVDVIDYEDDQFVPQKDYAFFIDAQWNFERIATLLNKDCIKIFHIDTAHWLFHNTAQLERLRSLQHRRGISLLPYKMLKPNRAIESADCGIVLGNEFTVSTYQYSKKPIYHVPISCTSLYPWPEDKDFNACRRNFLWFNSGGFVHKGLDLVLEVFADLPQYFLTICGPIDEEKEFRRAFYRELYETPNIQTIGWIDTDSPEFLRIANSCSGVISISCSEGGGGSVIQCMHAGLLPLVSSESSVTVDDFGFVLKDASIDAIKSCLETVAMLPVQELKARAQSAWKFARANHTRERFAETYRKVVEEILSTHKKGSTSFDV